MALKQLILRKDLKEAKATAEEHRNKRADIEKRAADLQKRESEAEAAVEELSAESSKEERAALDAEAAAIEAEQEALVNDTKAYDEEQARLDKAVEDIEADIKALDERTAPPKTEDKPAPTEERGRKEPVMENRTKRFGMTSEQRAAFFAQADVKTFIEQVRSSCTTRSVSGGTLTIPEVMLDVLRDNMTQYSKLAKHVTLKRVKGKARQNIMGAIPEAVWTEAVGALNELDLVLNQVEVDGYMIGGWIPVSNAYLEDSDMNLGMEIMDALGKGIGLGLDRAILFGTGIKMPLGIISRLKQTTEPSDWGTNARAWTDLHTTNIKKLNIATATGAAFFVDLIKALGVASPLYSDGEVFWVMNRATHLDIMAKALAFVPAALISAGDNTFPVIGGTIEEIELLGDNEIAGGFGSLYLLSEREGQKIESSEHVKFLENQTVFKGTARYDGKPVIGEGFVMVSYDNTDAVTTNTFKTDYANTALGVLGVTAAAGTGSGDTVLTVTGAESSGTTLWYKIGEQLVKTGDKVTGFADLTSGTTQITCVAGKYITVVELDGNSRVIKAGKVVAVPKA